MPEYSKASLELDGLFKDKKVRLGKVDCTVEKDLAEEWEVKGFPTLKWFVNGEASAYDGPRQADGIVKWVKEKVTGIKAPEPPKEEEVETKVEVLTNDNFKSFIKEWSDGALVEFYAPWYNYEHRNRILI